MLCQFQIRYVNQNSIFLASQFRKFDDGLLFIDFIHFIQPYKYDKSNIILSFVNDRALVSHEVGRKEIVLTRAM